MLSLLQRTMSVSRLTDMVKPDLDYLCIQGRKRWMGTHELPPLFCLLSVLGITYLELVKLYKVGLVE